VNVIVEGLAASAAFTVSMAGDTIQVGEAGMLMLHNASCFAYGYASDLRKTADLLDKHSGSIADMYAKRSGLDLADVQTLMDAETWLTADEAIEKGFADSKLETTPEKNSQARALAASFNLERFCSKIPDALKSSLKNAKNPKSDDSDTTSGCTCTCDPCQADDCENCTHDPCDASGCTCANHVEAKACVLSSLQRMRRELEIAAL